MNSLQNKILEIFKEIQQILDKNEIDYYAIGGTCIGAVRHNGFIPWDDDLDIAVPIEQFEFMIAKLKEELPNYLMVYTGQEIKHYRYIFIKVIDKRTTYIEKSEFDYPDAYKGVYVDIMPLSGVEKTQGFCRKIRLYHKLNICKRLYEAASKSIVKRIMKFIIYYFPPNYDFYRKKYMSFLKKHAFCSAKYTGYVWWTLKDNLIFPKEDFDGAVLLPFEDTYIKCPIGYDNYLTKQFGDYMCLPNQEERVGHHYALVKLDIPYTYYQKNQNRVTEDYIDD